MNRFHFAVRLFLFVSLLGNVALAQKSSAVKRRSPPAPNRQQEFVVGEAVVYGNLAVFPVSSAAAKNEDRFITLDEGLKAGTVEVFEKGAALRDELPRPGGASYVEENPFDDPFAPRSPQSSGANRQARASSTPAANDVNSLMVVNKSNKPLYLMPGEIIIGGRQDRTIARELVIAADKKPVAIDVFCVEHGRWGARDDAEYQNYLTEANSETASADSVTIQATQRATPEDVAKQANSGKFIGSIGSLNKQSRLAVQTGEGQQKVWDEVNKENAKAGVRSKSGAFTGNYAEGQAVKRLEPYIKNVVGAVAKTPNVVGVIVAVNGKVESMDVFESTPLFKKLWPKLLKSYALDAANASGEKTATKIAARSDATTFLRQATEATAKKTERSGSIAISKRESDRVLLFSAHAYQDRRQSSAAAGLGGGLGGAIHSSGYGK